MRGNRHLRGRRGLRIAVILCFVAGGLVASSPAARAVTCPAGSVTANEDDYTDDGVGAFTYSTSGGYPPVDAAHGVLANDEASNCLKVDLSQTVDDPSGDPNLVTTQDQSYAVRIFGDGHFTYCAGFGFNASGVCIADKSWGPSGNQAFSGSDSFNYCVWDAADHADSDCNTVFITIAPVVHDDSYYLTGSSLTVPAPGVFANDSGVDPGTVSYVDASSEGTVTDELDGGFTYTPPTEISGFSDTFTYDVYDLDSDNDYTRTVTIYMDATKPTASMTGPHESVTFSPTFTVSWSGSDSGGSGFSHYDVEKVGAVWNGTYGSWTAWKMNTTAISASFAGTYGRSYCFRVHAVDNAHNVSPWSQTCISVPLKAGSLSYSTGWHTTTSSAYFGGYARYTTTKNARAWRTGVRAKHIWLVMTRATTTGTVQVLWNNVVVRNINTYSSTTVHRKLLLAASWTSPHTGTLSLKVLSSGKIVKLEGLDVFLS